MFTKDALAFEPAEAVQLLKQAESLKTSDNSKFVSLLESLDTSADKLSPSQLEYFRYLQGWQAAYNGNYNEVIRTLNPIIAESKDVTLRFRAYATITNVLAISSQHEEAYSRLGQLIDLLPQVVDKAAREQGLIVAALLYNQVGQYDLGLQYADLLIEGSQGGRSACIGKQLRLEALHKRAKLKEIGPEFQVAIDECENLHEFLYANLIRTYVAEVHLDQGRHNDAIKILTDNLKQVQSTHYSLLISTFDALLAHAYKAKGDAALTRQFASRAIESGIKREFTKPLVIACQLLYELAKEQGDTKSALAFYEKYSAADKGYLNDISARQLAYEKVKHDSVASKMQIDGLNKQNEVLKLRQALTEKAVETSRLYIVMLVMGLAFVVFMAYRTKRSQMHFKNLSRLDGLTGLSNRPHFIDLAERALEDSQSTGQPLCVIICDLDYFKRINDTFGHAAGDTALKQTAAVFQAHLRKRDIVGRLGGEEFAMVLIDCDAATAQLRCDEIRLAIAKISVGDSKGAYMLSASFGIAVTCAANYELRKLLADADAALYQAKLSGRNRVVQYVAEGSHHDDQPSATLEPLDA